MFRKLLLTSIPALAIGAAALGLSSTTKAAVPALPIGQVEQVEDSDETAGDEDGVTEADRGRGGRGWGGHRGGRGWGRGHGHHRGYRHYHGRHYRHYGYGRYYSSYGRGSGSGSGCSNCEQE